jgi:hypothetical protein
MKTIELDDETAEKLKALAAKEHISLAQLLKQMAVNYRKHQDGLMPTVPESLTDFAGLLKDSPSFQGNPLEIQQAMRNEWS